MPESEEEKGFKVTDKRRVTLDDQKTESLEPEAPPKIDQEPKEKEGKLQGIDFSTFILSLGSSALILLGDVEDPIKREKGQNLSQAREMIDLLALLEEKTKGNLSREEEAILSNLLFDLRMRYVEKTKKSNNQG